MKVAEEMLSVARNAIEELKTFPPVPVRDLLLPPSSMELQQGLADLEDRVVCVGPSRHQRGTTKSQEPCGSTRWRRGFVAELMAS